MTLKERIARYFQTLIPVQRVTTYQERHTQTGIAATIDVDRLHTILVAADNGDPRDLFALYNEIVLGDLRTQALLQVRKMAVLGDTMSLQPADKTVADDVKAAEVIKEMIADLPCWETACVHLLDAVLRPVAVLEKVFKPSQRPGLRYELADLVPVSDQLLDWSEGRLRIRETDPITGAAMGGHHEIDPHRYIVFRGHLMTAPDWRGGPMRSLLAWWMLSTFDREWWGRFLERYGAPFLVGKYNQADDASRRVLANAFSAATRMFGLVVSKETEVELKQATASDSGDAFEKLLACCQREKALLILGQTLTTDSQPLGIGGGASKVHEMVRQDLRMWDARQLGSALRRQLFAQMLEINGLRGRAPMPVWGGASPEEGKATGEMLSAFFNAGLEIADEGLATLSEQVGLPLRRKSGGSPLPPPVALGARTAALAAPTQLVREEQALEAITRGGTADLARAFRGALAPVRRLVAESTSAEDLEAKVRAYYADWNPDRVAAVVEEALIAQAAVGVSR